MNVKQPELHYPDEDCHWLLMRLSPCPQCGYQPRLGRSIVRLLGLYLYSYQVCCPLPSCGFCLPSEKILTASQDAVRAWELYCRLSR